MICNLKTSLESGGNRKWDQVGGSRSAEGVLSKAFLLLCLLPGHHEGSSFAVVHSLK